MTEPSWYARFSSAWREDKLTPFGPMTELEARYLEAHWQLHCAQMFDIDTQLRSFARNCTGILGAGDVESDQGRLGDTKA